MKPLVSIVIEGYNEECNGLAPLPDTLEGLLQQDFPLKQAELLLLGSAQQIDHWKTLNPGGHSFGQVKLIPVDPEDFHYWQVKNIGAKFAESEIVALIDSDALPERRWLSSLVKSIQNGADVSVGPSLYRSRHLSPYSPWLLVAAFTSWALVLGRSSSSRGPQVGCIMAHNVALRRTVFLQHPFRHIKRSFCSALMYFELVRSGVKLSFEPEQKVAHAVTVRWWLGRRHFRTGWETYIARTVDKDWPRIPVLEKVRVIEPILLRMGLVWRDGPHWFRFARVVGVGRMRAILLFPLALLAAIAARGAEMVGMYAVLFAPKSTEYQARF
jgi:glycosyltransferase involved in cell wall biosynthesis